MKFASNTITPVFLLLLASSLVSNAQGQLEHQHRGGHLRRALAPNDGTATLVPSATPVPTECYDEGNLTSLETLLGEVTDLCLMFTDNSPQNLAYEFVRDEDYLDSTSSDTEWQQRFGLAAFYYSITADPINFLSDWVADGTNECAWSGITCDDVTGMVTKLDIPDRELEGTLAAELQGVSFLTHLNVNNNPLSGSIPAELGNLSLLGRLTISDTAFSGSIPSEFGKLDALTYLEVSNTMLTGEIPSELGNLNALTALSMFQNGGLYGTIPTEFGNLSSLKAMSLLQNGLQGTIPSELGNISSLSALNLSNNFLEGDIPSEMGNLNSMNFLFMSGSSMSLSATIPKEICNGARLYVFQTEFCNGKAECCNAPYISS